MENVQVMVTSEEMNLVRKIARRVYNEFCPAGSSGQVTLEDLYHYGIIGLLEAKKNFNPERGVPWLIFAGYRVRGAMIDQLRKEPIIRLPQEKQKKVKELAAARARLESEGIEPSSIALADDLGWTEDKVYQVQTLTTNLIPIDTERKDRGGTDGVEGVILKDEGIDPETAHIREELYVVINKCLKRLEENESFVFVARILKNQKLKEIAKTFSCSLQTVKNWQDRALAQMRTCLEEYGYSV